MNAMNQIIIEGNVIRQPSVKETPNGKKVCIMPIAVNRLYKDAAGKDADEVGYFDVETWGEKFTDRISKFGYQGRGVRVVGRLKQDRWKDDKGSHSKIFIVAEHVDFKPYKKTAPEATGSTAAAEADSTPAAQEALSQEEANLQTAAAGVAQEAVTVF